MSISQLRPADGHLALAELEAARGSVRRALQVPATALSVDELTDGIAGVAVLKAQVAALELTLAAEADRRRVAQSLGATGTDAWLAQLTGGTRAAAAGGLWLARRLQDTYHATREALADGGIGVEQARVIVRAAEQLPDDVTPEQRTAAEAGLVVKAVNGMDARRLRQAGRRMLEVVSAELADRHEAAQLEAEERRAEVETWLTLGDNGDGTWSGRFVIPELHGHMLRAALERLTSPRRLARNAAGDVVHDDTMTDRRPPVLERAARARLHRAHRAPAHQPGRQGGRVPPQRRDPAGAPRPRRLAGRARVGAPGHRHPDLRRGGPAAGLRRGHPAGGAGRPVGPARPRPRAAAALHRAAPGPLGPPRHLRRRGVRTPLRLVRHPPPARLERGRRHRPGNGLRSAAGTTVGRTTAATT